MPCSVPSSPGRPCSTLSATSGLSVLQHGRDVAADIDAGDAVAGALERVGAGLAGAQADTSRSADQPPIRTATCLLMPLAPAAKMLQARASDTAGPAEAAADQRYRTLLLRVTAAPRISNVTLTRWRVER